MGMMNPRMVAKLAGAAAAVTELAITVAAGAAGGSYLDARLGSSPFLALILSLLALILGFIRLTRSLKPPTEPDGRQPPNP